MESELSAGQALERPSTRLLSFDYQSLIAETSASISTLEPGYRFTPSTVVR